MREYDICTDGGCRIHTKTATGPVTKDDPAAYAYKVIDTANGKSIEGAKAFMGMTNNRMELRAVMVALERLIKLAHCDVRHGQKISGKFRVISDSRYVDLTINDGRLDKKAKTGFNMANGDEWERVYEALKAFPDIKFCWVKGHAENKGNIYVDHKLNRAMDNLPGVTPHKERQHE